MTDTTLTHKRGDSFDLLVSIPTRFADGYFAGHEMRSQVRTADGVKLADLGCAWLDDATTRTLRLTCLDTANWVVGTAKFDVQFKRTADNFVLSSTTAALYIVEDVTRDD